MEITCLRNHFLIAMPTMADPNFNKTVTLICEHTSEGALGITINQPANVYFEEILSHLDIRTDDPIVNKLPVLKGGPLQCERGFVLHSPLGQWQASLPVSDELAITASKDVIEAIAEGKGPEHVLTCLGYAGWESGQLEEEIGQNMWLEGPANVSIIFDIPFEERWQAAAQTLGVDINFLSNQSGHD